MSRKLCFVIYSLEAGGAERVLTKLANYFQNKGNQVTILLLTDNAAQPFYWLHEGISVRTMTKVKTKASTYPLKKIYTLYQRIKWLRHQFLRLKPDTIVSFIDKTNILAILAATGSGIPVIVSERIDPNYHEVSRLLATLRRVFYRYAHKVVVQTESARSFFHWLSSNKVYVIPNPVVENTSVKSSWGKAQQSLVSVGRLTLQKDHETLIRAFAHLRARNPNLTLDIYGEGPMRGSLTSLIHKLDLGKAVRLPGISTEILQKLSSYDIFIFPSLYEGFPNALAEAMSVGLAVVASNCSGNIDLIKDNENGLLFTIGSVSELVSKLELLLANKPLCIKIGHNAQMLSTKYSTDKIMTYWKNAINN